MRILFSIWLITAFLGLRAQVGGERIYNFLNIPTSASQAALGGDILTLNDDVNQPLWNPATISLAMDNQAAVNYVSYLADIHMGSLTFAHTYLSGFFCNGLIGEYPDPDLPFTFHVAGNSLTGGLYLTTCNPALLKGFDTIRTESQLMSPLGIALHPAFLLLSILCLFRL